MLNGKTQGPSLKNIGHMILCPFPDETWWRAVEAVRQGQIAISQRFVDYDQTKRLKGKKPTSRQLIRLAQMLHEQRDEEHERLIANFPLEPNFWKQQLHSHAELVLELKEGGFHTLSRLASEQLSCGTWLAERKLSMDRRKVRYLVGKVNLDLTTCALTAASYSNDRKALDLAEDAILEELPKYNEKIRKAFRVTDEEVVAFLTFLQNAGLQQWYTELSIVGWQTGEFLDYGEEQRISMVYGRARTMAVLLEEGLVAMSEEVGDEGLFQSVSEAGTLQKKLNKFINFSALKKPLVSQKSIDNLHRRFNIFSLKKPTIPLARLNRALNSSLPGYGIHRGKFPALIQRPVAEHVLAGLTFVRNLTSHRFPAPTEDRQRGWFEAWSDHLPAMNRNILWGALLLWKMTCIYRERSNRT